jgi:hypothetical protein
MFAKHNQEEQILSPAKVHFGVLLVAHAGTEEYEPITYMNIRTQRGLFAGAPSGNFVGNFKVAIFRGTLRSDLSALHRLLANPGKQHQPPFYDCGIRERIDRLICVNLLAPVAIQS